MISRALAATLTSMQGTPAYRVAVRGRLGPSVIVAAQPPPGWTTAFCSPRLCAVGPYQSQSPLLEPRTWTCTFIPWLVRRSELRLSLRRVIGRNSESSRSHPKSFLRRSMDSTYLKLRRNKI
jgi:hypothetical protein